MLDIYGTLEVGKVLNEISDFSCTEKGKNKISSLKILPLENATKALKETEEMINFVAKYGKLPINSSIDLLKYVEMAKKGGVLTPLDLEHIATDILTTKKVNDFFRKADKTTSYNLKVLVDKLIDLSALETDIHKVVSSNLSIKDDASPILLGIRSKIHKKELEVRERSSSLISKFHDYLTEDNITIRNDHFVLPVNSSYKSKISGIIHDISDSGQTTFIEPSILVDLSNEICVLHIEEKEEIYRLLKELSEKVAKSGNEISLNNDILGELDFIAAKATYAIKHDALGANFVKEKTISLIGAKHPLIDKTKVIANDFNFDEKQRIIIISGPNAGGKTVALKTLGLLIMMSEMGIPIPTREAAVISYFPRIYADIGDNQSLSDNLSTFAAHVSNLSTITHFVTSKDLVLLDELGTGTSPNEGEALALAISDFLLKKQCFAFISSHFEKMKEYAYRREGVKNAMMVFDEKNLVPTYMLKIGYPGRSYGLEMANRYHLDKDVIDLARKNLNKTSNQSISDVIDKLNKVLRENEQINAKLKEDRRLLEGKTKDINHKAKVLEEKKTNLLEDVNQTKAKLILDVQKQLDDALKVLNDPGVKPHQIIEAKRKIKELNETNEQFEGDDDVINVGDYVEAAELSLYGKVIRINKNKVEMLTNDGMSVKTTLNKLKKIAFTPEKRQENRRNVDDLVFSKTSIKLELNLIGKHVDEAIDELAKYLDDCLLRHFSEVRIIHGMGTGALRDAVREYLDSCEFVSSYRFGESFEGSTGATVVTLK